MITLDNNKYLSISLHRKWHYRLYCEMDGKSLELKQLEIKDNQAVFDFEYIQITDDLIQNGSLLTIKRKMTAKSKGNFSIACDYFPSLKKIQDWGIPSVFYKNNVHGHGKYPTGAYNAGWSFREDRSSVPGCIWTLDEENYWASLFLTSSASENEISSTQVSEKNGQVCLTWKFPYEEAPSSYIEKGILIGGQNSGRQKFWQVHTELESVEKVIHLTDGIENNIDSIYEQLYHHSRTVHQSHSTPQDIDWEKVIEQKFHHLQYLIEEKNGKSYLLSGKGNGIFQPIFNYTAGSFLVRGLDASWEVAQMGLTQLSIRMADFFLDGQLQNGLHQDNFGFFRKKFGGYIVPLTPQKYVEGCNSRCNGEVFWGYLQLYRLLQKNGIEKPEYLKLVKNGLDFYKKNQLDSGSFGRWWSKEGQPISTEGTNGAHLIGAFVDYIKITNSTDYDDTLTKAYHYYSQLILQQEYYGDTLDADCMDKEAGVILMKAFLALYEWRSDPQFLDLAKKAARYNLSWVWTYNVAWPENSPCHKNAVKSVGLTSVSVDHHHLDFYGYLMAYDFFKLWKLTQEIEWRNIGLDLLQSCAQLIASEKNNFLGRSSDFIGWQPEQINHTTWDYASHYLRSKGDFHNCIAWPVTLGLHGLLKIKENFPEFLSNSKNSERHHP